MSWTGFLLLTFIAIGSMAQSQVSKTENKAPDQNINLKIFKLGMAHFPVGTREGDPLIVSYICFKKMPKCEALKFYEKMNRNSKILIDTTDGKNPGAQYCKEILKNKVLILKDSSGNEDSFCQFNDGSILSNSSIEAKLK